MQKYNWQTVGLEKISQFLQKNLANNKLAHAYLFVGKEHIGKNFLAREFSKTILCQDYHEQNQNKAESFPCNQCVFCSQFDKGIHPDVYFLKKEEDKKNITVEQVREMQKILYLTSFLNSYKIVLVEKAEELSEGAQNALLKILEEPRPKTILILIANNSNSILPTITSRCRVIKFQPVASEKIFHHLLGLGASREQARLFSALVFGQIGLAINFYDNPDFYQNYLEQTKQFIRLWGDNLAVRFKTVDNLLTNSFTPLEKQTVINQNLENWQLLLRDILLVQNNLGHLISNLHFQKETENLAKEIKAVKIIELQKNINQVKKFLNYNINPRLAVENLVINL